MTKHIRRGKDNCSNYNYSVNVTLQSHFGGITEKQLGNSLSNINQEAKYLKTEEHLNQKEII